MFQSARTRKLLTYFLLSLLILAVAATPAAGQSVFGDGIVWILKAPGQTPGHRMLLIKLQSSGSLLISGDLYHTRENYKKGLIPVENVDRANTLASFNRFAGIQANTHARVIIQHSPADFASMPTFPKYLD